MSAFGGKADIIKRRDLGITDLREQNMISIRTLSASFAAVALSIATVAASAEKWPERPIKVISPFTAGNAGDTVARIVFDQVSQQIGQTLFIENRPGAGGTLAADFVAKGDPDGYTLLLSSASLSSQVIFHRTLPYDAIRAFAPVSLIGIQPTVVIASPSRGFITLADLVAAARAKPGTLTFASAGVGSASHMAAERLRVASAIDVRHIPFRGAEGLTEVMAGRVDFSAYPVAPAVPLINAGKLTVLAVSTRKRAALLRKCRQSQRPAIRTPSIYFGAESLRRQRLQTPLSTNCMMRSRRRSSYPRFGKNWRHLASKSNCLRWSSLTSL
jgi:tripartite-type tricarboxylate transporter receptor subunit TctC